MGDFLHFIFSVGSNWVPIVGGGVVMGFVGIVERFRGKQVSLKLYAVILSVFVFIATFMAWQEQDRMVQNLTNEKNQLSTENASLSTTLQEKEKRIADLELKLEAKPTPIEVRLPQGVQRQPEPPIMEGLRYQQERTSSPRPNFPYAQKVVVQTDVAIQPTALLIECDGEIGDAAWNFRSGGAFIKSSSGILRQQRTTYYLGFEFPPFTPESPLVVTLFSKDAIKVIDIKRTMFRFP